MTNTADSGGGSLRYEIGQANSAGGANTIAFGSVFNRPQTIMLTGTQLELSNTIEPETIAGPAAGVTVSGGGLSGVFQVDPDVTASISGLTITGGSVGGIFNEGMLTIEDSTIQDNSTTGYGGGGLFNENGTVTIANVHDQRQLRPVRRRPVQQIRHGHALRDCTISGNIRQLGRQEFTTGPARPR